MARRYRVGPQDIAFGPPTRRPGGGDVHGLGERHWSLLALLAEHGTLHTGQVTTLMFGSRPAAVRHLNALLHAGLVWRFVNDDDSSHLAYYELSGDGATALQDRYRHAGRPAPVAMGRPGWDLFTVNEFFVGLAGAARTGGRGHLYRWRRGLETAAWLRGQGVTNVRPRAYGVWIEDDVVVRFLLHVDHDEPRPLSRTPAPPPQRAVAGYRRTDHGVPVTAVLMICPNLHRETALHEALTAAPVPVRVAATTRQRLSTAPSAAEAVWTVTGTDPTALVRLADLARQ